MYVALLGVSHDELVKLAEKEFSGLSAEASVTRPAPASFTGSEVSSVYLVTFSVCLSLPVCQCVCWCVW